ncbi:LD-carboxypeptidase [Nonomuraea diastatica]|uniref:LD-carboxypeptidase n=1 Tax=Nonomuraea diastatica TaxID=1848329 RepID=A0A4R4WGI5_9ACTN|nr:LD-carboxypeptidase [Nonomuraea diastatica]
MRGSVVGGPAQGQERRGRRGHLQGSIVKRVLPPALRPGDTIGVLSPSSDEAARYPRRRLRAAGFLRDHGYQVRFAPSACSTGDYTAGSPEERAEDLHRLFADPSVTAIVTAIGGNNSNQLLDLLDFDLIAANPKLLIGYSDVTALLTAIWWRTGLGVVMGPQLLPQFGEYGGCLDYTMRAWRRTLENPAPAELIDASPAWTDEFLPWDSADDRARATHANAGPWALRPGRATGPLYGANLTTLLRLAGTPYWPDLTGHLLLLESSLETTPSQLDAELTQLRQTGLLNTISAIGFGRFGHERRLNRPAVLEPVLNRALTGFGGPVVCGLDIGHTDPMFSVPYGLTADIAGEPGRPVTVTFVDGAVR